MIHLKCIHITPLMEISVKASHLKVKFNMLALARHGCFSLAPFISPIVHFVPSTLICLLCLTISGTILSHSCTYAVFSTWIILLQDIYVAYFLTSLKSLLNYQCLSEDLQWQHSPRQQSLFLSCFIFQYTSTLLKFVYILLICLSLLFGCKFTMCGCFIHYLSSVPENVPGTK
jgi:hypothetical protein